MNCYFHPNEPAVTQCAECGRGLCRDCASAPGGNLCRNCIEKAKSEKRALLIRSIAIFAIVFVLCLSAPGAPFFVALFVAGTPCGWRALSSIQPRMFLFLPIIGWPSILESSFFFLTGSAISPCPCRLLRHFELPVPQSIRWPNNKTPSNSTNAQQEIRLLRIDSAIFPSAPILLHNLERD